MSNLQDVQAFFEPDPSQERLGDSEAQVWHGGYPPRDRNFQGTLYREAAIGFLQPSEKKPGAMRGENPCLLEEEGIRLPKEHPVGLVPAGDGDALLYLGKVPAGRMNTRTSKKGNLWMQCKTLAPISSKDVQIPYGAIFKAFQTRKGTRAYERGCRWNLIVEWNHRKASPEDPAGLDSQTATPGGQADEEVF